MKFLIDNKWKIVIFIVVLYILVSISSYTYYYHQNLHTIEKIKYLEFNNSDFRDWTIGGVTISFDLDLYLPEWDTLFNWVKSTTYSFVGYNLSLILDLIQISILFFSGIGFINILIFNNESNPNDNFNIDSLFWRIYLISFLIYVFFVLINIVRMVRNNSQNSKVTILRSIGTGLLAMSVSLILIPSIFLVIDILIYLVFIILFPFMIDLINGNNINISDGSESLLGNYTLSTILLNSSFKDEMGGFGYVPNSDVMFPSNVYEFHFKINAGSILLPMINLNIFDETFKISFPLFRKTFENDINFLLFYLSEGIVLYFLIKISIRLIYNSFNLFLLYITGPLYFSSIGYDGGEKFREWFKIMSTCAVKLIALSSSFLLFSISVPTIISGFEGMEFNYDKISEFNIVGFLNIISIIGGLYFTTKVDKLITKQLIKYDENKMEINVNNENVTNNSEINNININEEIQNENFEISDF